MKLPLKSVRSEDRLSNPLWVILPLGGALALSLTGDNTLYASLPSQPSVAGITIGMVGWILGLNRAVRILLNPLAGMLYDRSKRRSIFIFAMCLGVLSTSLYAVVDGFWPLVVARIMWGAAWALLLIGGYTIVFDLTSTSNRGRFTGLFQTFYFLGGAFSVALGGILMDVVGYRTTMWICAGLTGIGTLIAFFFLPETRENISPLPSPTIPTSRFNFRSSFLFNRRILAANFANLIHYFVGNGILMSTLGFALVEFSKHGQSIEFLDVASLTGILLAARRILSILIAPTAGILSDKTGDRWAVSSIGLTLILAGFGLLAFSEGLLLLIIGVIFISIGSGTFNPALTALIGDLSPPERKSAVMGSFTAAADIGSASGPILAYSFITTLSINLVYGVCGLLILTALVALWMGRVLDRKKLKSAGA